MGDWCCRMLRTLNLQVCPWGCPEPCWVRSLLRLHLGIIEVDANKTLKTQASILCESAQARAVRLAP